MEGTVNPLRGFTEPHGGRWNHGDIMKMNNSKTPIAVAWYRPEQWALLKAYSVDRDELENTFTEWVEHAERSYKKYEESGLNMHKVVIDVDILVAWCKTKNIPLNAKARSQYAADFMREIDN